MNNNFSFNVEQSSSRRVSLKSTSALKEEGEDARFIWDSEKVETYRKNIEVGIINHGPSPFFEKNPILRKGGITFAYTDEEIEEIKRCQKDPLYFADKYAFSMTDEGIQKIQLRDYQREIIKGYHENRSCVLLSSRQSGKTVMSSIFLVWYFCFNIDKNLVIVANKGATTTEIVDKIKNVYYNLPFFLKPGIYTNNLTQMTFDNGCRLYGFTTSKTPALGFTVHFLYADEFAHIPPNIVNAFWQAIYPTMSASQISRMIITSTANGVNKFFHLYQGALKGENSFFPLRVDWWQVPFRTEEWKNREIENLGSEESFNQEYGNQFVTTSMMMLNEDVVRVMDKMKKTFVHRNIEVLDEKMLNYRDLIWHPDFDINRIFDSDDKFVFSIDTSEGNGNDYIVINIHKICPMSKVRLRKLRVFNDETDFFGLQQVGIFRSNKYPIEEFADFLPILAMDVFNPENVHIILEMNYRGDLIIERFKTHPKFFIEMFVHSFHQENHVVRKPGVRTGLRNKPILVSGLRNQINRRRLIYTEKTTVLELSNFGVDDRYGSEKIKFVSQTGNDDVVLTSLYSGFYLTTPEFQEFVSQIFDDYDGIHKIIYDKLEQTSDDLDDIKYLHDLQN